MFNFYLQVILGCLYYPFRILDIQKSISLIRNIIKNSKKTALFSQYGIMIP